MFLCCINEIFPCCAVTRRDSSYCSSSTCREEIRIIQIKVLVSAEWRVNFIKDRRALPVMWCFRPVDSRRTRLHWVIYTKKLHVAISERERARARWERDGIDENEGEDVMWFDKSYCYFHLRATYVHTLYMGTSVRVPSIDRIHAPENQSARSFV
jgi:hypothetical protein